MAKTKGLDQELGEQRYDADLVTKMGMVSIASKELTFEEEIGSGSEGSVYKGEWKSVKNSREEILTVAIKKLLKCTNVSELKTLSGLSHPNIINVFGIVEEHCELCIVMELCPYSLRGYFERNLSPLSDEHLLRWSLEAARPLEYLRKHKILHRDVKPENYLVDCHMVLKLTDFGLARKLVETVSKFTNTVGTIRFMAPEVHGVGTRQLLSPSYDIFSLGLVLWYLVARKMPYSEYSNMVPIATAILRGERPIIPDECPAQLAELIQECWSHGHKDRPDISQIIIRIRDMISLETTGNLPHLRYTPRYTPSQQAVLSQLHNTLCHQGSQPVSAHEDGPESYQSRSSGEQQNESSLSDVLDVFRLSTHQQQGQQQQEQLMKHSQAQFQQKRLLEVYQPETLRPFIEESQPISDQDELQELQQQWQWQKEQRQQRQWQKEQRQQQLQEWQKELQKQQQLLQKHHELPFFLLN